MDFYYQKVIDEFLHKDTVLEGISNVTLIFFTVSFIAIVAIICSKCYEVAPLLVHPELLERVQNFRSNAALPEEVIRRRMEEAELREIVCAICLGSLRFTVLTNCGHLFCCECVHGYWNFQGNVVGTINCPVCRTPVTVLLPVNWPVESSENDSLNQNTLRLDDYNRRFSGNRPWIDYFYDLPVLIPYIFRNLFDFQGLMMMFRLRAYLICFVICGYVVSPFDIIPESIYGALGFLDDIFVVVLLMLYISIAVRHFLARRGDFD